MTSARTKNKKNVFGFVFLRFFFCLTGSLAVQAAETSAPLKICLLSASSEYDSEKSLAEFQSYLETNYHITCSRAFGKDKGEGLPGLDALDSSDLMIVFTRRVKLPPAQLEQIHKHINAGKPIIGLRTASHAFADYMEFDKEVLGGGYTGHFTNSEVRVSLVASNADHPILKGVTPFVSRKLYKNPTHAPDIAILLEGSIPGHREPVAWCRTHSGGR